MRDVVYVDDSNFEKEVLQSELPVVVDFGAPWCGPCQRQVPIIEKFASNYHDKVKVCAVDVDESPKTAAQFSIKSVPSIVLFDKGQKLDMKVGLSTLASLDVFLLEKVKL